MRKFVLIGLGLIVAVAGLAAAAMYLYAGAYGLNAVLNRGGSIWVDVSADDPKLSQSMRIALKGSAPEVTAGSFEWRPAGRGFDVAELPVMAEETEVDRLMLARIDPGFFDFRVLTSPPGDRELDDWMEKTGAALVVNGSYYDRYGNPDTPVVSNGVQLGPREYNATHGAFVVKGGKAEIRDLKETDWYSVLKTADEGLVSYPLLVSTDPERQTTSNPKWLANRSFIAQDSKGRIIIGTTKEAYFSLQRLASFLKAAPLDLAFALNLDGGPLACQGIDRPGYTRNVCGDWETATEDDQMQLLQRGIGNRRWGLPIVLAVFEKP
ncbi:phosphodiester glycosidase family protein [uncultured Roseibium sp.]|uniref:phosphodiester glycosidase family protein n=1 Tax=uncultured Roseibium sp. TaxID=1936171 RepID=UPI003217B95B